MMVISNSTKKQTCFKSLLKQRWLEFVVFLSFFCFQLIKNEILFHKKTNDKLLILFNLSKQSGAFISCIYCLFRKRQMTGTV